ncbi:MAG TPA: sigma-54-dependent Fis family transcriptional regulator [Rhodanobacteraceae bacterium]|jgi:transcriptional regulator of acetoin/glycerol metabolism|nr:sigma-54-dependent Fis family transcriptional regulator [Rhodanobacteraceae bacterium]
MTDSILSAPRTSRAVRALLARRGVEALVPHIHRSWNRCVQEFGIQPQTRRDTVVLPANGVRERQQELGGLLNVARCEMENLYDLIAGTGYAVILSNGEGTILSTILDPTLKREFQHAGLWLGARWDERHEGTNGIGTCLAEGSAITVHRDEHFRDYNVPLSCSSAPILDAHGKLLGVLDTSSVNSADTREIQRHTVALVSMSASLISRCQFLAEFRDSWILRFHSRPEFVGLLHEALLAVNGDGRVLAVNESAMLQLGVGTRAALVGRPVEELFRFAAGTMQQRATHAPASIWPIRDVARGRRYYALVRPPHVAHPGATLRGLSRAAPTDSAVPGHVTTDPRMRRNLSCGHQLFAKQVPILLRGATGTGKDVFARALHAGSLWSERPFVTVNCAAIPENLIESELFGYRPGAFTGAAREGRKGKILQSSGGTLFLDEIGDMPLLLQARLLRAIEAREIMPVGSDRAIAVDLHVISATHRDLRRMIAAGEFREDLYYRLAGTTLELPSLADRQDKGDLIRTLLLEESGGEEPVDIAADAFERLLHYHWPGNIRQLRNVLRTAAALCRDRVIRLPNLPQEIVDPDDPADMRPAASVQTAAAIEPSSGVLQGAEQAALLGALEQCDWNVSHAARVLQISRNTLYRKLRKHGIRPPQRS